MKITKAIVKTCVIAIAALPFGALAVEKSHTHKLLWGDTHLHSSFSFDAYLNGNMGADPDTAYRWAKGQPVVHPYSKTRIQIETPLDFLVLSDHAEFLGFVRSVEKGTAQLSDMGVIGNIKRWLVLRHMRNKIEEGEGADIFRDVLPTKAKHEGGDPIADPHNPDDMGAIFGDSSATAGTAWAEIADLADEHYEPGKFTTMLGWEWTSIPTGANLHRVVMSSSTGEEAKQYIPFSMIQSQYPEDLWQWMEETEKSAGVEFISIPHNSNVSKGYMFAGATLKGKPITADYARKRMKYEPVAEVTQIKGDSETHPVLSPEDEFADFETFQFYLQKDDAGFDDSDVAAGDYIRSALKRGLQIEQKAGENPYKFGMIGSTDAHTSVSSAEEGNFWGKMASDSIPENKRGLSSEKDYKSGIVGASGWDMSASGLAAVWAEDNTREAIFAAFKRKEVYATSGPRISVRFFGGWDFDELDESNDIAQIGYAQGTTMGGDLSIAPEGSKTPEFLIQAIRDPLDANLDRIQVVKGWVDQQGQSHERIYNVAWSGNRALDQQGRLPAVGDTVDRETGEVDNRIGLPELETKWQDPDFEPAVSAFYYARVLQIPTARHSMLDALALGVEHPDSLPEVIQERAYTSPIWYNPVK